VDWGANGMATAGKRGQEQGCQYVVAVESVDFRTGVSGAWRLREIVD